MAPRRLDRAIELLGRQKRGRSRRSTRAAAGFTQTGWPEAGGDLSPAVLAGAAVVDLRDPVAGEQILEDELVHADRRGLDVGARVGDVEHLEQSLDAAVLSAGAVQDREGRVAAEQALAGREADRLAPRGPAARRGSMVTSTVSCPASRRPAATEAAERSETSCSLEIPPPRTATLMAGRGRRGGGGGGDADRDRHRVAAWPREPPGGNSEITRPTWPGSTVVSSVTDAMKPGLLQGRHRRLAGLPDHVGHRDRAGRGEDRHLRAAGDELAWARALAQHLALRLGRVALHLDAGEPAFWSAARAAWSSSPDHARDLDRVGPARDQRA